MFIQTQETPNPQTLKFIPGVQVLKEGTLTYHSGEDCSTSPLAAVLLEIEGVKGIFLTDNFISVTKDPSADWSVLKPIVLASVMDHFVAQKPVIMENAFKAEAGDDGEDNEAVKQIKELIETRVRPAVANDGGDIIYKGFKEGVVYVELHGACSGCPSSTLTLKSGIENMLKHYIPEVKGVESV
ncbi:putative iron-sulfur cluster scaffold, NifU-like protein [endosymbiont of Acanthamoeba sp. UWC8]|uniref:NifU family protein n=1 Tax=endosymbiont of Acanthamoeba sp. UWC8 TaxID=86106 RepID=UPI0004D1812C|nr:NifU family protein [endosymbiont of Acanthamoeba sp. UWC8]AIF81019.1 putative iron-sulfur cluster scaffold, NifU-like protein [endosymbiont of Acanthamoeba sp. UWC8]